MMVLLGVAVIALIILIFTWHDMYENVKAAEFIDKMWEDGRKHKEEIDDVHSKNN